MYSRKWLNAWQRHDRRTPEERDKLRERLFARYARLKNRRLAKAMVPLPWVRR